MNSWRTTLIGVLTGLVIIARQLLNGFDGDPATVFDLTIFLGGLAAMGLGTVARDNGVSSERAGAK